MKPSEVEILQYSPIGKYQFFAPSTVHIELTNACPEKCRHCYNFWRQDNFCPEKMTRENFDLLVKELVKNKVFHVILTGGEPLVNYDVLLYAVAELKKNGLTGTCNSNLVLATKEKMEALKQAGLPHILTSLNSYRKDVNDFMVSTPGAYEKILAGIRCAVDAGIVISVNMIISKNNIKDIYNTAELAAKLGAKKFNATRTVPPVGQGKEFQKEFEVGKEDAKYILEQLLLIERDLGLVGGALIAFPHCFLGDLSKYRSLLMRGCPAGSKMMSINVDGSTHACVHEAEGYGNVFEIGLQQAWENMKKWRTGELIPEGCKTCSLFDVCNAGCRMVALSYYGPLNDRDNLKGAAVNVKDTPYKKLLDDLKAGKVKNSPGLRFRKEKGFTAVNVFGAETFVCKVKSDDSDTAG